MAGPSWRPSPIRSTPWPPGGGHPASRPGPRIHCARTLLTRTLLRMEQPAQATANPQHP
jgi:hypothetical protein